MQTESQTPAVTHHHLALLTITLCAFITASPAAQADKWLVSIRADAKPDKTTAIKTFEAPKELGSFYGARIRGFVHAPKTGEYIFAIASDDQSKLFLSTDASPENRKQIAHADAATNPGHYKKFPSQMSKRIQLQGGKKYYIEAIHRQNGGGGHVSVAWLVPGSTDGVIPGKNLSPYPSGLKGKITHELWRDYVALAIKGTPAVKITSKNDPTKPVPGGVHWFWRDHRNYLNKTKADNFELVFLGDSITQGWPGDLLGKYFGKHRPSNFGIGGDRTENVLFRLNNGELLWTTPKLIVLMLGTNNSGFNESGEMAVGVAAVIHKLRSMLPETKILLLAIFPSKDPAHYKKTTGANAYLAKMDDGKMVRYLDINEQFMDENGKLRNDVMKDGVHLNRNGYVIWGESIVPMVDEMME